MPAGTSSDPQCKRDIGRSVVMYDQFSIGNKKMNLLTFEVPLNSLPWHDKWTERSALLLEGFEPKAA